MALHREDYDPHLGLHYQAQYLVSEVRGQHQDREGACDPLPSRVQEVNGTDAGVHQQILLYLRDITHRGEALYTGHPGETMEKGL